MATSDYTSEIPYGYCHCGCGNKTNLNIRNDTYAGDIKGEPKQYLFGHAKRYSLKKQTASFWSKVAITADDNQCWLWQASCDIGGYGNKWWNKRSEKAHRVSWMITNGEIPDGLFVLHKCDNPPCCNPKHLFLGTYLDNVHDMMSKGRDRKSLGEKHFFAKLTDKQVIEIRERYAQGGIFQYELGEIYGVNQSSISAIVLHKARKHT